MMANGAFRLFACADSVRIATSERNLAEEKARVVQDGLKFEGSSARHCNLNNVQTSL